MLVYVYMGTLVFPYGYEGTPCTHPPFSDFEHWCFSTYRSHKNPPKLDMLNTSSLAMRNSTPLFLAFLIAFLIATMFSFLTNKRFHPINSLFNPKNPENLELKRPSHCNAMHWNLSILKT